MNRQNVEAKVASGVKKMTVLMIAERALGLLSTLILARILLPEDFGIVAMCMSIVAALELFTAFGFDVFLIQHQEAEKKHYDTAWTLRLLIGAFIAIGIAISAHPTAVFYDEPRVIWPMYLIALSSLLRGFENIGVVNFRKNLQFAKEATFQISQRLCGFCVTIPLAYYLANHWALIIGIVMLNLSAVVISYVMSSHRPALSLRYARQIMQFSGWLLINNTLRFIHHRTTIFLLGRHHGAADLGVHQMSSQLSSAVTSQLVAAANRAIFPGYAKLSSQDEMFVGMFLNVVALTALCALPLGVGLVFIAPHFVEVALGDKWLAAGAAVQITALAGTLTAMKSNCTYVLYAKGKPRVVTILSAIYVCALVPVLSYMIPEHGVMGAVTGTLIVSAMHFPLIFGVTLRFLNLNFLDWLKQVIRPIAATGVMSVVLIIVAQHLMGASALTHLLVMVPIGAVVYIAVLALLIQLFAAEQAIDHTLLTKLTTPRRE